jgi:hypothetical protein
MDQILFYILLYCDVVIASITRCLWFDFMA